MARVPAVTLRPSSDKEQSIYLRAPDDHGYVVAVARSKPGQEFHNAHLFVRRT